MSEYCIGFFMRWVMSPGGFCFAGLGEEKHMGMC
jgi:hypothetical protein